MISEKPAFWWNWIPARIFVLLYWFSVALDTKKQNKQTNNAVFSQAFEGNASSSGGIQILIDICIFVLWTNVIFANHFENAASFYLIYHYMTRMAGPNMIFLDIHESPVIHSLYIKKESKCWNCWFFLLGKRYMQASADLTSQTHEMFTMCTLAA